MNGCTNDHKLIDVTIDLLLVGGYEAVQVRTIAKQARVSLRTIYQLFGTRDALIVAAISRWMDRNVYSSIVPPGVDLALGDALMSLYRQLLEPWTRQPKMLAAFHRARTAPGGDVLDVQGRAVLMPMAKEVLARVEPSYGRDVGMIVSHVFYAVVGQFAEGTLGEGDLLPTLERTVTRLTSDNGALATAPQGLHAEVDR